MKKSLFLVAALFLFTPLAFASGGVFSDKDIYHIGVDTDILIDYPDPGSPPFAGNLYIYPLNSLNAPLISSGVGSAPYDSVIATDFSDVPGFYAVILTSGDCSSIGYRACYDSPSFEGQAVFQILAPGVVPLFATASIELVSNTLGDFGTSALIVLTSIIGLALALLVFRWGWMNIVRIATDNSATVGGYYVRNLPYKGYKRFRSKEYNYRRMVDGTGFGPGHFDV